MIWYILVSQAVVGLVRGAGLTRNILTDLLRWIQTVQKKAPRGTETITSTKLVAPPHSLNRRNGNAKG